MTISPGFRNAVALARRVANALVTASAVVGGLALLASLLVILADVIGRSLDHPISGSPDIIQLCFVLIVFGSVPICERTGGNVRMDLFDSSFSASANRLFDYFAVISGVVLFALIAWRMWESAKLSMMLDLSTNVLRIAKAPFQICVTVACLIVAFSMLVQLIEMLTGADASATDQTGETPQ